MNFAVPDRVRPILEDMASLLRERVFPIESTVLSSGFDACAPELEKVRAEVVRRGLWGPQLPVALGGIGLTLVELGLVSEVLGRSPLGHYAFGCQAPDAGNIEILHQHGTDAQKQRWLTPLAAGEIRSCFSMTEPDNAGSNPIRLSCTAQRDGDDYVINGHKWFTSSAEGAAFAIVMAVTNPDAAPHRRASQLIVPTDTPGFDLVRNIPIMGDAGSGWASHAEIRYDNCRVPQTHRLGAEGAGFVIAQERLGPGRIHHCMRWIGICERAFEMMCARAASRDMGEGRMLDSKQLVRAWIAEARAEINAARLMVLQTAWKIDAEGFFSAREDVSLIKFYVASVLMRVVDRAVQVHGALGITSDTVLSYFYAHERGARIYDGPDEVHKMAAAKRILERTATRPDA